MTRSYYNISLGPHGVERCPFCKPKLNEKATNFRGTKLGPGSEIRYPEDRETENADLQECLNQSSVSQPVIKMPQTQNSSRNVFREIRASSPNFFMNRG